MRVNIIEPQGKQLIQLDVGDPFKLPHGDHPERIYVRPYCPGTVNLKTSFPCPCISYPGHCYAIMLLGEQPVQTLTITVIDAHIESTPPSP